MIGTQTQQTTPSTTPADFSHETSPQLLVLNRVITHSPKAGLNPLVDAASFLFSAISELKRTTAYRQLNKLQKELIHEVNTFQDVIGRHGYNAEYLIICRYVLCATLDDVIANTPWGGQGQWDSYNLLAAFNQDVHHQSKFFTILERAINEPTLYIDLMEFIYISLSMGYKGQYRSTEHSQYQLEQITNNLYKHIRAYRGNFSKTLSPVPLKAPKALHKISSESQTSLLFIFFITTCVMMSIFIGLDYLMDVISNEAYKNIDQIKATVSHETAKQ